ncbi:hypothetical protein SODALDRAFT_334487 [Sodiomyces alkalinus F11]|uniref:Uncharacterized protein n=1 Tax=Sodiomyces alkalinus (strain CBS 110278 / VKM F-3762 / F11) TaxID=1314773 RepID=A0A3N2PSJ4_SODAK|nr:hypothetical protein SODALDRAFT_334487 [Sodiomyces alkalinus F11]ROT37394.1 hypothetical protein SODALDRAFT_334487 [Sodiomyces alkalinus F11]
MCVELSLHSACGHASRRPMNCARTWRYKTSCFYPLITAVFGNGPDKPCEKIRMRVCKPHPCLHCSAPFPGFEAAPVVGGPWPLRDDNNPEKDQRHGSHREQQQQQQRPISKALPPIPLQPVRRPQTAVKTEIVDPTTTMHADDVYQTLGILSTKAYTPDASPQRRIDNRYPTSERDGQPQPKPDHQRTKDKVRRPSKTHEGATRPSRPAQNQNQHPDGPQHKRHGRSNNPRNLRIDTSAARPKASGSRKTADPVRRPTRGKGEKSTDNGERTPASARPAAKTRDSSRKQLPGKLAHLYRCDGGRSLADSDSDDESFVCADSKRVENQGWVEIDLSR